MREPRSAPAIPGALRERYRDCAWEVAWHFDPGAIVYKLTRAPGAIRFVKLAESGGRPSLASEAERMLWAADHLPVPEVVEHGSGEEADWLVTRGLPGLDATDRSHRGDGEALVRAVARGLRAFHETPVDSCPFELGLDTALARARKRLDAGLIDASRDFHDEFSDLTPDEAVVRLLRTRPDSEDLVVCHGDYCMPNVLLDDGRVTGYVDLGALGVADRWWDLAVATWSLEWNLGPGYRELFLDEYGVGLDRDRVEYFRLLYDVIS